MLIEVTLAVVINSVWPSAGERIIVSAPMVPLAPARLSTTMAWPSASARIWPTVRATTSVALPAVNGTMKRTGRFG